MFVEGISKLGYNPDKLKGRRVLLAKAELLLPNKIIQQGCNAAMKESLEYVRDDWQESCLLYTSRCV